MYTFGQLLDKERAMNHVVPLQGELRGFCLHIFQARLGFSASVTKYGPVPYAKGH